MARKDKRTGEQAGIRTNRTFVREGSWFFKTREGQLAGPFQDELEASVQLEVYIRMVGTGMRSQSETLPS
ncbi:MAG: hypothetical protein HRT77_11165 [Halioglobus sp.]|nr:hypothetical protein [Halioglobus sp.]